MLISKHAGRSRLVFSLASFTAAVCFGVQPANAFKVTYWSFGVSVYGDGRAEDYFGSALNPFHRGHIAQPDGHISSAAGQYDCAWSADAGCFKIASQLVSWDGKSNFSEAFGGINLRTETDLIINVEGIFNYNLPGDTQFVNPSFRIYQNDTKNPPIFLRYDTVDTYLQYPKAGTISFSGSVLLPAGNLFLMPYGFTVHTSGYSAADTATADGILTLQISPAPEPVAISLLLPSLAFLLRRGRR